MSDPPPPQDQRPEFGPSGYLPERASKRARKIVLRAPLGLQWVVAAMVAGLVVLVAGVLYLRSGDAPPPAPWVAIGTVEDLGGAEVLDDRGVLLVGAGGRVRAFPGALDVAYCERSNRLEAPDGRVWNLTGRGLGGTTSLDEHPVLVQDGTVYLDPTVAVPGPPSAPEPATPACG